MYTPYVRFANFQTQLDSTAKNTLGAIYSPPANPTGVVGAGYGAQPVYKYVYYNSTLNPAPEIAPAPVYYTDETFTVVSGAAVEAYNFSGTANGAAVAGYLGPNTVAYAGLTAAELVESYCWIQIGGLLSGAFEPSTQTSAGLGNQIYGAASGNWTSIVNTTLAASQRTLGIQWSAIAGGVVDVLVSGNSMFWGS